jgi:hypothetical protein
MGDLIMAGKTNASATVKTTATEPTEKKVMTLDQVMDLGKLRIKAIIEPAVNSVTGIPLVEKATNSETVEGNITYDIFAQNPDGSKGVKLVEGCRFPIFTSGGVGAGSRTKLAAEPNAVQSYRRTERNIDRFVPTDNFKSGIVKAYRWMQRAKAMLSVVGGAATEDEMSDKTIILTVGRTLDDMIE